MTPADVLRLAGVARRPPLFGLSHETLELRWVNPVTGLTMPGAHLLLSTIFPQRQPQPQPQRDDVIVELHAAARPRRTSKDISARIAKVTPGCAYFTFVCLGNHKPLHGQQDAQLCAATGRHGTAP